MSITRNNENNNSQSSSPEPKQEGLWNKVKTTSSNVSAQAVTTSKNTKETISIQKKQMMISNRKKAFGIEYLELVDKNASDDELKECIDHALEDISILKAKVSKYEGRICRNKEILDRKLGRNSTTQPNVTVTDASSPVDTTSNRSSTSVNAVMVPEAAVPSTPTDNSNSGLGRSHNSSGFVTPSPTIAELPDGVSEAFQNQVPDGVVEAFRHPEPSAPFDEEEEVVVASERSAATGTSVSVVAVAQQPPMPSAPMEHPGVPVVQPLVRGWSAGEKSLPSNDAVVY